MMGELIILTLELRTRNSSIFLAYDFKGPEAGAFKSNKPMIVMMACTYVTGILILV